MATLDLKGVGKMPLKTLANTPRVFPFTLKSAGSWAGATAVLTIKKETVKPNVAPCLHTLTIGNGLTLADDKKILIALPALPVGSYLYEFHITPPTGYTICIMDRIISENG